MNYADYPYYSSVYMGAIDGTDFQRLVVKASAFIDYYTRGKAAQNSDLEAVKMCCCALVDKFAVIEAADVMSSRNLSAAARDGAELKSESVGSYSRTLATAGESAATAMTAAENARAMLGRTCQEYLAHTSLLYRGGRRCTLHIP